MTPPSGSAPRTVLFLCTGNSCRSQIAEALVNAQPAGSWRAVSAGVHPAGFVHPKALQVLQEIGIAHVGRSKSAEEFAGERFDLVVTVCDDAAEECPVWLGEGRRAHLGFPDPARAQGTPAEQLAAFRNLRDQMSRQIPLLLDSVPKGAG